ncbi:hypothetical protein BN2476_680111 [Paraburkholderia piptadeniae]|uniref:Uncharacterized protein n=1 Tax=Paraburkholderia piptadeniae TaxID=1701573 RepID=A0A1N7SPX3_9BURK|nr:hypothetical protein BN2476_680111 [Paraburkholderia piptadeniae]
MVVSDSCPVVSNRDSVERGPGVMSGILAPPFVLQARRLLTRVRLRADAPCHGRPPLHYDRR